MSTRLVLSFFIVLMVAGLCIAGDSIVLKPGFQIYLEKDAAVPLHNAVTILQRDLKDVLGKQSPIVSDIAALEANNCLVIVTNRLDNKHLSIDSISGYEEHRIFVKDGKIILQGADLRGTLFAIFTFSEKFLNIKPLWFWASLKPQQLDQVKIPADFSFSSGTPHVKYRAWFPNDMDMLEPWRALSAENNEAFLETMLRLKLNTVNWDIHTFDKPYSIDKTTELIKKYGMVLTFHHHNPLNACFSAWPDYWKQYKKEKPPELLLANEGKIKEYWRYSVKTLVKNGIEVVWVVNFRGNTDGPYWDTFKDAPKSMKERADVVNRLVKDQVKIIKEETGDPHPVIRMIFYNELSDLLAKGLLNPPDNIIWTFVAARRDHFPNDDLRKITIPENVDLGYYMNLQFTSTGSHLAQAEGPWKMEANYRYVNSKGHRPLVFSEVNAGNIREHVMELSANAEMLWNFQGYKTDSFLLNFCNQYFGASQGKAMVDLYKAYYDSYWNQKKNDLEGFQRQYIFHDLRYQRALGQIAKVFFKPYDPNPLKDMGNEQLGNRTFRIVPEDNGTQCQIDSIIKGTGDSIAKLEKVTQKADSLYAALDADRKVFFNDNLRVQANFMLNINKALHNFCFAYRDRQPAAQKQYLSLARDAALKARKALHEAAHDNFATWYKDERIFGLGRFTKKIDDTLRQNKGVENKGVGSL